MKHGDKVYKQYSVRKFVWEPGNRDGYQTAEKWWTYGEAFRFRAEPVPDIHRYPKSPRGYHRHPRTTQELRWIEPHSEFVRIRGKRTKNYLPTWYDDKLIADNRQRGWKRTKKKRQWMKGKNTTRMTTCFDYGISGGCDPDCPVLLEGDCPEPEEVIHAFEIDFSSTEVRTIQALYVEPEKEFESIW